MLILRQIKAISMLSSLEYKAVHRKKFFGIFWKFLNPLILILVYVFVFSILYESGSRGFMISTGILLFSGISSTINSSTNWVEKKLHNFAGGPSGFNLYFASKVYFNFIPIFYLNPVLIVIQRLFFNQDFKFTIQESLIILAQLLALTFLTMIYCLILSIPTSIFAKRVTDLKDIVPHILRIATYLSPILWIAKTGNTIIDLILQILNPFYFIFEILNVIIYRSYDFSIFSIISPIILVSCCFKYCFRDKKYSKLIMESLYI